MPDDELERAALRRYLGTRLGVNPPPADDEPLANKGYVASLEMIDLVLFVEREFNVVLDPIDLVPENLSSIATIARAVAARRRP